MLIINVNSLFCAVRVLSLLTLRRVTMSLTCGWYSLATVTSWLFEMAPDIDILPWFALGDGSISNVHT